MDSFRNTMNKVLEDSKAAKVDLKSIPVLREKLFFKVFCNRKLRWSFYLVVVYLILFRWIGFQVQTNKVNLVL